MEAASGGWEAPKGSNGHATFNTATERERRYQRVDRKRVLFSSVFVCGLTKCNSPDDRVMFPRFASCIIAFCQFNYGFTSKL